MFADDNRLDEHLQLAEDLLEELKDSDDRESYERYTLAAAAQTHSTIAATLVARDNRDLLGKALAIAQDEAAGRDAAVREQVAADIEAYQPAAHPVSCPPSIAYAAAMETAARIAREGSGEADHG